MLLTTEELTKTIGKTQDLMKSKDISFYWDVLNEAFGGKTPESKKLIDSCIQAYTPKGPTVAMVSCLMLGCLLGIEASETHKMPEIDRMIADLSLFMDKK